MVGQPKKWLGPEFFKESVGQFEAALKRCFQMESGTESFVKRVVTVLE